MSEKKEKTQEKTHKETKEEKKIKELEDKEKELVDTLKRLQAEFENYKKRVDKEKAEFCSYSKSDVIRKLLPIIDTFEIAIKNKDKKEDFIKGMEMIFAEMKSLLQKEGVKPIEVKGKIDPNLHDVLLTEKSDQESGTILEELQRGYMLNDKVLRHSKVKVAK